MARIIRVSLFAVVVVVCVGKKAFVCFWYVCSFCTVVQLAAADSTTAAATAVVLSLQYS